jgi:hypothetical protein
MLPREAVLALRIDEHVDISVAIMPVPSLQNVRVIRLAIGAQV